MNKNSYVTASLFAVFVLLTVLYFNLGINNEPEPSLAGIMPVGDILNGQDNQDTDSSDVDTDDVQDDDADTSDTDDADTDNDNDADNGGNGGTDADNGGNGGTDADNGAGQEGGGELGASATASSIQALRSQLESLRTQTVSRLEGVIASADYDAQAKSQAHDELRVMEQTTQRRQSLEAVIRSRGFNYVLVRSDGDNLIITIEIESMDVKPPREQMAEIYVLAMMEFSDKNNINIVLEPLN